MKRVQPQNQPQFFASPEETRPLGGFYSVRVRNVSLLPEVSGEAVTFQVNNLGPTIDGFTPDQQFFIAWGQWRGDEIRPETQRLMVQGDPHPIAKYRVIGPLSNIMEFGQAFGCKAGSAMMRIQDHCEVW
jgi:predicted metalloendopeptidase